MSNYNSINATVLQKNNGMFICDPCGGYGQVLAIPVGSNAQTGAEYWARPVKEGYFQGFRYVAYQSGVAAPTIDSIRCFKLTNTSSNDYYFVVGTIAQYAEYAASCCATSPSPSYITTLGAIASCQDTCTSDGTNYKAFFAVETLADIAGGRFVATVTADGAGVLQQTYAAGSTSLANLITYLNVQAATVGTWSNLAGTNTIVLTTTLKKTVCFVGCIKTS